MLSIATEIDLKQWFGSLEFGIDVADVMQPSQRYLISLG